MAWPAGAWKIVALAGLALFTIAVGVVAVLILASFPENPDVAYGEVAGRPLLLDIYRPSGPRANRAGVILIHGGGWAQGDKSNMREWANMLTKAGYVAIAVGYRLAKDDASRHPAQVEDVRRAVRWVRSNAAFAGVDPARLGTLGHSAGGHLAAMLGTTDEPARKGPASKIEPSRVACVVDCCGPTDFTDDSSPPVEPVIADMVTNLFGKARAQAPEAYRDASPIHHIDSKSSPTLIVHGTKDDVVSIEQSRKFRDALQRAGVEVKLVELPGEGHVFQGAENHELFVRETLKFLDRHLKP